MLALLQMFNSLFFHLLSPASLLLLAFCSISEKKINTRFPLFTWSLFLTTPASLSHQLTICITQYTKGHNSFQSWFKAILK